MSSLERRLGEVHGRSLASRAACGGRQPGSAARGQAVAGTGWGGATSAVGRRPAEADRDGGGGLAGLGGQLRDAARRQAEGRPPDVDRGDDVAARVVDRGARPR